MISIFLFIPGHFTATQCFDHCTDW